MYCPECGKQIDDDSKFCEHCGKPTDSEPREETPIKTETSQKKSEILLLNRQKYPVMLSVIILIICGLVLYSIFFFSGRLKSDIPKPSVEVKSSSQPSTSNDILKIHGLQIGMSVEDVAQTFPLLNDSWQNDIFYSNGKKYLRPLLIFNSIYNELPTTKIPLNENIDSIEITFKAFKVCSLSFKYKNDLKDPDQFATYISNTYNLPNQWLKDKDKIYDSCCRNMEHNGLELEIGISDRDYPFLRMSVKGYKLGDEFE